MATKECEHKKINYSVMFFPVTETNNESKVVGRILEVQAFCGECNEQFEFVGVPTGMSFSTPTVTPDFKAIRLPIAMKGDVIPVGIKTNPKHVS